MKIQKYVNIFVSGFMLNPHKYNPLLFSNIHNVVYQKYYVNIFDNFNVSISDNINTLYNIIDQIDTTTQINLIGHSSGASIMYKLYSDNLQDNKYKNINGLVLCNPVDYNKKYSIISNKNMFNNKCFLFDSLNNNDDFFGIETSPSNRDYRMFTNNFQKNNILLYNKTLRVSHNDIYDSPIIFNIGKSNNNKNNINNYCTKINSILLKLNE